MSSTPMVWDEIGKRTYTTGVDHVALYLQKAGKYPKGVPWSGITTLTESPSGAEESAIYADNIKYLSIRSAEDFGLSIECYDTPEEFDQCDGCGTVTEAKGLRVSQQTRAPFGLAYRTKIGSDEKGDDAGYEIHMVYGCTASPSELAHNTINDSPEPGTLSYEITTVAAPISEPGLKPAAHLVVSSLAENEHLKALEKILFGGDETAADPMLPLPDQVISVLKTGSLPE